MHMEWIYSWDDFGRVPSNSTRSNLFQVQLYIQNPQLYNQYCTVALAAKVSTSPLYLIESGRWNFWAKATKARHLLSIISNDLQHNSHPSFQGVSENSPIEINFPNSFIPLLSLSRTLKCSHKSHNYGIKSTIQSDRIDSLAFMKTMH